MKKFLKTFKFPLIILAIGLPLLYCELQWIGRIAAVSGCHASSAYNGSYEARVYCNRKADALTWGLKRSFEANGSIYVWNKDAESYYLKGEVK